MSRIGAVITLTEAEQRLAKYIGTQRYEQARARGVKDVKIDKNSNAQADIDAFGGELAFCRLTNTYPDLTIGPRSSQTGSDDGDSTFCGRLVDVKSTKYKNGRLLAARWKGASVDIYALMVGTFPTYEFRGFMSAEELLQDSKLGDLGRGAGYLADQHELKETI